MLIITIDDEAAELLRSVLSVDREDALIAERRGIDGTLAEWMVLGLATLQGLAGIATTVHQLLREDRISVIKIGDVEVHHPRRTDVDELMRGLRRRLSPDLEDHDATPDG